ncbi:MAG: gliding motility-associated C-terminal domain-containing protein, partial [Crocinitomicaceae bacterium]|nr:gliding motility-associated C-terminal domain-containing protein [Crocinitomicaceae bacterium]
TTATLIVNPLPTVANGTTQAVDHGDVVPAVSTAGNLGSGATYNWTNSNTTIGLGASGTGDVPQFTAANTTAYIQTGLITVSATANGCAGPAQTYEVAVSPVPTVTAVADLTLCEGAAGNINFTGAPAATFFTWANDNTSVGIAASGSGDISFTAANTTNTTQTANITVTPQILVTDDYIFGEASEGQTLLLTAPAGKVITSVEFASFGTPTGTVGNYAIGSCHATNSASIVSAAALGQTSLTIAATTAVFGNPCVGTSKILAIKLGVGELVSGSTDVFQVIVNPTPAIADVTIGNCSGSTFDATPVNGVDIVPAGTTYTWTVVENPAVVGTSNVSAGTLAVSQTLSNLSSQSQSVTYTVTPTAGSCVGDNFDVTVSVAPTMTIADATTTICTGSSFSITPIDGDLTNVVPAGTLYTWDVTLNPNIAGATAQTIPQATISQVLSNNAVSNQIQVYTVTPQYTVGGTTCFGDEFDIAVTVLNGIPTVDVGADQTICGSGSASYTANVSNAEMGYWQTTGIGVISPNVTNTTVSYVPSQGETGTVDLTYIASNACGVNSDVATITITPLPNAGTLSGASALCLGSSETLTSSIIGGAWSSSNTAVATIDQNTGVVSAQAVGSTTITYTVTSGLCASSTTMTVTVNALPTATIATTGATTFCAGGSVALVGPSAPAGMTYSYAWNLNGVAIAGATANSYLANASGSYTLTVSNNNGCSATSAATTVTVNGLPNIAIISGTTTLCEGGSSNLTNTATGGTWSSNNAAIAAVNSTTGAVSAISAGSAVVTYTITDANGCSNSESATVTVNALPSATISATGSTTICAGGSVLLTASSASSYQWNLNGSAISGETAATYTASASGSYSVTLTNASGCDATSSATVITVNALPSATITAGGSTTICAGESLTLSANAGTGYIYQWSTGSADQSITVNTAGAYTVTITDQNGCTATSAVTNVTVTALPTIAAISGNTGVCVGSVINLTSATTGGTWTSSNTANATINAASGELSGVAAGTTTVTYEVTANGCTNTTTASVTINALPTATITATGATTFCAGGSVALVGPSAPAGMSYTYQWNLNGAAVTGATSSSYLANASGSYTLTVSNNNGCSATSAATTITVNALPSIAAITGTTTLCVGSGSTLASTTTGGTWSSNNAAIATINSSTGAVVAVSAGVANMTYTVTDANGCTNTATANVTVNALPSVASVTGAAAVCAGSTVQFESATAGGSWTTNNAAVATVNATGVVSGVSAGLATITYTITDANGCTNSASADINVNTGATATITAGGATTFCAGSNVVLTANAGSAYMWSTGAQTQAITVSNSGTYTVTVTNASGCDAVSAVTTVTVNPLPAATILAGGPTNFCQGGSVTLTASPQVVGSTYLWSSGATTASIVANTTSTNTVTITSAEGCSTTASAVTVTVNPLPTATITASGATTFCQGGSVTLTANGGTGLSYQWSNGSNNQTLNVTTAGSYTVTVTDANGCSSTSAATVVTVNSLPSAPAITGTAAVCVGSTTLLSTTASNPVWSSANTAVATVAANGLVTGVSAGTVAMTYTTTNANGCVNSQSVTVTVNTLPTAAISTMGATTFCQGGSVTLLASSPTAGMTYTYQWRLNGTAITGATASTYVANASGAYAVTITTNSACSATSAATTVTVNPLPVLAANAGATSVCENSTAVITNAQAGGLWSTANNTVATINATTGTVTGVNPGTTSLTYTFTNANGCVNSVSTNFTVNALPSAVITAGGATTFCQGGSVVLTASTGTSYLWSTGATTQSITVSTTQDVSVTVTNANGCAATSAVTSVVVNALPLANITSLNGNSFCQGGSVTLVASNGAAYAWSNGAITQSITLSASASVTVTVTNSDGCSATSAPFAVTMNPAPVATVTAGGPTTFCAGGSVTLTAPVAASYLWSSGETTQSIVASVDGPYSVTITDGNGCSATSANTNITVLAAPVVQAIAGNNAVCEGGTTTLTNATIAGTWSSSNTSAATIDAAGLLTGVSSGATTITYSVTNASGCTTAVQLNVNVNANPVLTAITGAAAVCEGSSTTLANAQAGGIWSSSDVAVANVAANGSVTGINPGAATIAYTYTNAAGCTAQVSTSVQINALPVATVTASGATTFCAGGSVTLTAPTGMTYAWSTGESTEAITVTTSGNYTVTVTNANGCSASSAPVAVVVNALPAVSIANVGATTFCAGGSVALIAPLNSNFTYAWNNGAGAITGESNNTYVANATGSYSLTVTDANGCTATSAAIPVTVNVLPVVSATANGATTFCDGGSVTLTATGATTYVWSNGATSPSITVSTSGNYSVTGTSLEGCSSTSNSIAVVVNALPTASIATSGSTACLGATVTLTASGGSTYSWSNGSTNASINVTAANTYTATVTSAEGCSSTASETVVFNANPAVVITANGPTVFCTGGSLTLSATGGSNYVWSNGDQGASTTVSQSGNYYVIVTNAAGCTTQSSVVSVTVNNNPVVAAITGANAVCEGGTMLLTSATQGGVWSAANNFIANIDAAGHVTGLNAGSTAVTYTVTVNGCTASTSAQVSVLNNPVTPTITASGTTTLCPGGTVVLFASNAANYQWSSGATTPFIVANQSGSYTVSVTATNGCSATSLPIEVFIGDNTAPVISAPLNVTTTPNLGCEAIGVSLGTPITSDNCGVASVTNDAPSIFPIGPTVVTWTVTDNSGNSSTATQVVTVVDNSAPTVQAPANVVVASNVYCEAIGVNLGNPIATDNCTENLTITNNAPAVYPLGNTTVTWTVVDGAGNTTTVDQVVTVNDESAPLVLLANTSVILDANGNATIGFEDLDNGSVDNCGIASAVLSQSAFDCANVGENFITVIVTDNSGNQSSASVLVTVVASDACGGDQWAGPSVPDAFTPNGNNYNDTWVIPGIEGYTTKSMEVYSRYGTIVYKADSYANDWDGTLLNTGTPVPDGTYYYILTLNGGKQLNGYVYVNRVQK